MVFNLFKEKREKKFIIAEKIIKGLKNQLEAIRILFKSTQERTDIKEQLMTESAQYDGIIINVERLLLSVLQKKYAKTHEELRILKEWLFTPLLNARIGINYNLRQDIYNQKINSLNLVLERLQKLEKGELPEKAQQIENDFEYSKAA